MSREDPAELERALGLPLTIAYGVGTMLGAGVYVLIGEVVAVSGRLAPLAFLLASCLAALSAFSFAELSSRFPLSAAQATYVKEGLGSTRWARVTGILTVASGAISCATMAVGFSGYATNLMPALVPTPTILSVTLILLLGALAAWGIRQSSLTAGVITIVEAGGLLVIILAVGWNAAEGSLPDLPPAEPPPLIPGISSVLFAAAISFYAYIGFEDMVNVAEEVRDAPRTMPKAILSALVITTVLYLAISVAAIVSLPTEELAASPAPLAAVFTSSTGLDGAWITPVALLAIVNGALIQIIMGSRVLHGMAREGWMPSWIGVIHPKTRTPLRATFVMVSLAAVLAAAARLATLASLTSLVILAVFTLVNASLWRLKLRGGPAGAVSYPLWVPATGTVVCLLFVVVDVVGLLAHRP